jgi:ribosomal protein S18 acetylase RimI-like enzyme
MAEHSIEESRCLGFKSIQFTFVVKSNEVAVKLWKSVGFEVIGEIADEFNDNPNGLTNAYIVYRKLRRQALKSEYQREDVVSAFSLP